MLNIRGPIQQTYSCQNCSIEFYEYGSLIKHMQLYCYKRNKLLRSATVTSQTLELADKDVNSTDETSLVGSALPTYGFEGNFVKMDINQMPEKSQIFSSQVLGGWDGLNSASVIKTEQTSAPRRKLPKLVQSPEDRGVFTEKWIADMKAEVSPKSFLLSQDLISPKEKFQYTDIEEEYGSIASEMHESVFAEISEKRNLGLNSEQSPFIDSYFSVGHEERDILNSTKSQTVSSKRKMSELSLDDDVTEVQFDDRMTTKANSRSIEINESSTSVTKTIHYHAGINTFSSMSCNQSLQSPSSLELLAHYAESRLNESPSSLDLLARCAEFRSNESTEDSVSFNGKFSCPTENSAIPSLCRGSALIAL